MLECDSMTPFGRTGRARGVDDGGDVVERCDLGQLAQVGGIGLGQLGVGGDRIARGFRRLDQHDRFEGGQRLADLEEPLEERIVLDDGDLGAAVVDEVLDLLGRRGVVDRHRRCAQEQHGQIERMELGPVAHHQHDGVALADAEGGETGRQSSGDLGEVGHRPTVPSSTGILPAHDLDGRVLVEVREESLAEVLSDDAIMQFLARGHRRILAQPQAK